MIGKLNVKMAVIAVGLILTAGPLALAHEGELHAEHVHPLARGDPQAFAGGQAVASEQAAGARLAGVSALDARAEEGAAGLVHGGEHGPETNAKRAPPGRRGSFLGPIAS